MSKEVFSATKKERKGKEEGRKMGHNSDKVKSVKIPQFFS